MKVDQLDTHECDDCIEDKGLYDFSRACCRARFLVSVPLLDLRKGWMRRWKRKVSEEFYDAIEAAVKKRWEKIGGKRRS